MSAAATDPTGIIYQTPAALVTIAGIPTPVESFTTRHGVDQPIGSASLTIPVEPAMTHIDLNATIEIQAGYADSATARIFVGRIVDIDRAFDGRGASMRVQAEDWATLLNFETEADTTFTGATRLADIFRAFAAQRGVPLYEAEHVYAPTTATHVTFGGIAAIDGGNVVLRRRTRPLGWLAQKAGLFGYKVFGSPDGTIRLQRVSGLPQGAPGAMFQEGIDLFSVGFARSTKPMVTNWTVYGARYTDDDGVSIELRSIPSVVPSEPYLTPPGYRSNDVSDPILTTQELADAVRTVHEIDHSDASEVMTWETWGRPEIQPGQVVNIQSENAGIRKDYSVWVMSVDHRWSDRGFTTLFSAWAGSGQGMTAGIDTTITPIGSGVYRLGDEYLPNYVIPAAGGEQRSVAFTVPEVSTSLALTGRCHGTNTYIGVESTVSKLEVWQAGERVGTADLPVTPESLTRDYTNDANWEAFRMPVPGQLEPGAAELRIIAGTDRDVGSVDDFEVKALAIEARGTGAAVLPEEW